MAKAVISTIGHDRPGLVSDITSIAQSNSLNIEDSRMTVLGGEFAVLMALEGSEDALKTFDQQMHDLCRGVDLAYMYRDTQSPSEQAPSRPYVASIVSLDHPGIVAAIAGFFSQRKINIRDLTTQTTPAAHTGTPIFNITLIAEIPATLRIHTLKNEFEEFCEDQDLDGSLGPSDAISLG